MIVANVPKRRRLRREWLGERGDVRCIWLLSRRVAGPLGGTLRLAQPPRVSLFHSGPAFKTAARNAFNASSWLWPNTTDTSGEWCVSLVSAT